MKEKITVLGLGSMGTTLADLLLKSGYEVTVWNRTPGKANHLVEKGAKLAADLSEAITEGQIIVICVLDYEATKSLLEAEGVNKVLTGKIILQLTTISPKEARDSETWASANGAGYVNGAIQAAPGQMGRADTPILVSGDPILFETLLPVLQVFGGGISYLGANIAASPTMDLATLSYIYGASIGFFHGALISESEGIAVDQYSDIVAGITPTFGEFLKHEGYMIHKNQFQISESPLSISVEATARLEKTAIEAGINAEFPAFAASLLKRADSAGLGNQGIAALIKILRETKNQKD